MTMDDTSKMPDDVRATFEALHEKHQASIAAHGAVDFTSGDGEYVAYLGTDDDGSWWAWVFRWGVDYGKAARGATREEVEAEALRIFGRPSPLLASLPPRLVP
jgi:hypothetical protein